MKKIFLVIIVLLIFFGNVVNSFANSYYNEDEMGFTLNSFQKTDPKYQEYKIEEFSGKTWKNNGLLVLKDSVDKKEYFVKNVIDKEKEKKLVNEGDKEKRYLGITPEGYIVENPDFPANAYNGKLFSKFEWVLNENDETSLIEKVELLEESKRKEVLDFYWNLIEYSFTREYGNFYDKENITPEMKERILNSAILVYPLSESIRKLLSFRNTGKNKKEYEVTASLERGLYLPPDEPETIIESIPSLPIATQSKGNTLLIGSHKKGEEIFDIKKGIPSSETLYVNLLGDDFIAGYEYETHIHSTIKPVVKYDEKTKQFIRTEEIETEEYREITHAYVYALKRAEVESKVLENGKVSLTPKDLGVTVSMKQGSSAGFQDAVLTINGVDITAGEGITHNQTIPADMLYQEGIVIPEKTANQKESKTTGKLYYELVYHYGTKHYPAERVITFGGSPVTVHTPVVCYPDITTREPKKNEIFHQTVEARPLVIKEESFHLSYPTSGKHLDIKGYGEKDYSKYTAKRQVKFTFPVYEGADYKGSYIKPYTWVDFPEKTEQSYFIPSWAEEGENQEILFRSVPINLKDIENQNYEKNANLDGKNYKAVEKIAVSVFGKIDSVKAFSTEDSTHKDNLSLPIQPKEAKVKKRLEGVRLGYPVDFLVTTNADLFDRDDSIKVIPHYYFVDKKGKKTEVDVYYAGSKSLKKISEANAMVEQRARLREWEDKLKVEHIKSTAEILDNQKRNTGLDAKGYRDALMGYKYTILGDNSKMAVGERLKLYHGSDLVKAISMPKGVTKKDIERSKQSWYVRFFLPNESYVVPKGTDLKKLGGFQVSKAPFLHDGYILVRLEWQIYKDGEKFMTYYTEPKAKATIPYRAENGDSILYDSERRASHLLN